MSDTPDRTEFEERRQKTIWQRLDELDQQCASGHSRLRKSIEALESQFDALAGDQKVHAEKLSAVSEAPIDAGKLMLTGRGIIALVVGVLAIWTGQFVSTSGVKDDIRAIASAQTSQKEAAIAAAKLQDVQMATLRDAASDAKNTAADAKRQYELLRYEFQSLKETVIKGKNP